MYLWNTVCELLFLLASIIFLVGIAWAYVNIMMEDINEEHKEMEMDRDKRSARSAKRGGGKGDGERPRPS